MGVTQIVATVVAVLVTVVAIALFARSVGSMVKIIKLGQPDPTRSKPLAQRLVNMLKETLGHTRMLKWTTVGIAHWFVFIGFGTLALTLAEAFGEVVDPEFELPLIGGWAPYGLFIEFIAAALLVSIVTLIVIRQVHRRRPQSRFRGSAMGQAYYVEFTITAIGVCIFLIRGFKDAAGHFEYPVWSAPISHGIGALLPAKGALTAVTIVALIKIIISWLFFIVISQKLTMGVAWHRFAAFFNIFFKREADGRTALGALKPVMSDGKPLDFEEADPDKDLFGVSKIEEFSWKGLLDFSTCTECGRCQSQCPAWNTGKPLSPKLLITSLRDHAYAKAPYLLAGSPDDHSKIDALGLAASLKEAGRPLVGTEEEGGIIDPDVLWSCTTCGACVEQCPVDIEHVDHIVDMRRYQVMIESSFPSEAGVMLKNLESKGNPWGANPNSREDWTKGLDFEVPRVDGETEFEYLFWVGCAGALEDKAKKTTRAVATLLHEAGVSYAILGNGEGCTGDPARRIGNEFLFQMLAQQNVETLTEAGVKKIVATCPHCFNTIGNEYPEFGGRFEVVHHTELLSHLVATGKLKPVVPIEGGLTYHDPCYLGRHNKVYSPPREVLGAALGAGELTEMPRNTERSFCCGAGGARMYMEETIGKRINIERVEEALTTGAQTIAVGCPFCFTMLGDGVTGKKASGDAPESVEVVDVATVLLRSIKTS
ncbi:(Fe-S)-binding protein [Longispora urticae]